MSDPPISHDAPLDDGDGNVKGDDLDPLADAEARAEDASVEGPGEGSEGELGAGPATERPAATGASHAHAADDTGEPDAAESAEASDSPDARAADEPSEPALSPDPATFGDDDYLDRTSPGMRAAEPLDALYGTDAEVTVNLTGDPSEPPPDPELTVNLTGELFDVPLRDDFAASEDHDQGDAPTPMDASGVARAHLKGLLEALIFASDSPVKAGELAKSASAQTREVKDMLVQLKADYASRGLQLDEVAGGWIFRTNAAYAPFVRDLTKQKPVKLTRAQIETLAILAYRQPITRPEIDEIRGVDSGPVLKMLLERDLVKILGKKDEPGRPLLYGTTPHFLEFFGLKSLKDLPTLREFTELNEDSRRTVEKELGETLETVQAAERDALVSEDDETVGPTTDLPPEPSDSVQDTIRPAPEGTAASEESVTETQHAIAGAADDGPGAEGSPSKLRATNADEDDELPDGDEDSEDDEDDGEDEAS